MHVDTFYVISLQLYLCTYRSPFCLTDLSPVKKKNSLLSAIDIPLRTNFQFAVVSLSLSSSLCLSLSPSLSLSFSISVSFSVSVSVSVSLFYRCSKTLLRCWKNSALHKKHRLGCGKRQTLNRSSGKIILIGMKLYDQVQDFVVHRCEWCPPGAPPALIVALDSLFRSRFMACNLLPTKR